MPEISFLSELTDYLDREGIVHSSGNDVDIFVSRAPDDPDDLVALFGLVGTPPSKYIADFEYPRFQVYVRNIDYMAGETKIRQIRTLLHDKLTVVTEHFVCKYIQADSDIIPIGQDDKGRYEFTLNFSSQILNEDSIT